MKPVATILSTGTELSSGRSIDTNGPYLASTLADYGFQIRSILTLPDDPTILKNGVMQAIEEGDLLVMTGGLGPTEDDYTIDVLCEILGVEAIEDERALRRVKAVAARTSRVKIESARRQTRVPDGAGVIENKTGLAPGVFQKVKSCTIVAMPGVPTEMKAMFESVFPQILSSVSLPTVIRNVLYIYGEGESSFQGKIFPSIRSELSNDFQWGISASPGYLRVFLESLSQADIQIVTDKIQETYEVVLSQTADELLAEKLTEMGKTFAVAESCTGGMIGKTITDRPGSSAYFPGGVVCYSNESKVDLLSVDQKIIEQHGAVSKECAEALALGVQKSFDSSFGLSVTGIAGPGGGTAEKPVGTVWIGVCDQTGRVESHLFNVPPDRQRVRQYSVNSALYRLLLFTGYI